MLGRASPPRVCEATIAVPTWTLLLTMVSVVIMLQRPPRMSTRLQTAPIWTNNVPCITECSAVDNLQERKIKYTGKMSLT